MSLDYKSEIRKYKFYLPDIDEALLERAIAFAVEHHGSQLRASGEPYYKHPLEVARILASMMESDLNAIIAAILHDTVEDTDLILRDIERHFGHEVAVLVDGVTKLSKIASQAASQAQNSEKFMLAQRQDKRILKIKIADRLHNMRTLQFITKRKKQIRIATETEQFYAQLAEDLGMYKISAELKDISFEIKKPNIVEYIKKKLGSIDLLKNEIVDKIKRRIEIDMVLSGLDAVVEARIKSYRSINYKMRNKKYGTLRQMSDILGCRIIVNTKHDCYLALGVIHSKYRAIVRHFQDFISNPKSNNYQSLHTVVFGIENRQVEIQIRTHEMHKEAEYGKARHHTYKDNQEGRSYSIDNTLLCNGGITYNDWLKSVKSKMKYNEVFCLTKDNDIISLPKNATILDFAYHLGSEIGNSCIGAKVDGMVLPYYTKLVTGQQIDIITSKDQKPSPEWEDIIVTGKAFIEIRRYINCTRQVQTMEWGTNLINGAISGDDASSKGKMLEVIKKYFKQSLTSLVQNVGSFRIDINDLLNLYKNPNNAEISLDIEQIKGKQKLHFAKCCMPMEGEHIIGIPYPGFGIVVHRSECQLIKDVNLNKIKIDLDQEIPEFEIKKFNLILLNIGEAVPLVTNIIWSANGDIISVNVIERHIEYKRFIFEVLVYSDEHIAKIIDSLREKKFIQSVSLE